MPHPSPGPLPDGLPVPAPFFLRQFRFPDAWGEADMPLEDRVGDAVARGFNVTHPKQSLFLIRDGNDLRRVIVGMCAGRQKPTKRPFHYVPFTPDELAAVGIVPVRVAEDQTGCFLANRELHHDAEASEDALRQLCRNAFGIHRTRVDVEQPALKVLHATAAAESCPARPSERNPSPPPCQVAACTALPPPPVPLPEETT